MGLHVRCTIDYCITGFTCIISLGAHSKVYYRHVLRILSCQYVPFLTGIRNGIRISLDPSPSSALQGSRLSDQRVVYMITRCPLLDQWPVYLISAGRRTDLLFIICSGLTT